MGKALILIAGFLLLTSALPLGLTLGFAVDSYPASTMDDQDEALELNRIIEKMDDLYRSQSSYSEVEMNIITPHWERILKMNAWTLGTQKTFIRITSPHKEKGVATLRIGSEMWNYLPKVNKVIKIPPSMMMSSWMGSDFTNDDLVKEFLLREDYTCKFVTPDDAVETQLYIECIPREDLPVVWGKVVVAVRRADDIPVWQKFYDEKGNLMRILNFKDVTFLGGRTIPTVMEMIPKTKEGHKTIVRYVAATFDAEIDENIFSLRNLRSR